MLQRKPKNRTKRDLNRQDNTKKSLTKKKVQTPECCTHEQEKDLYLGEKIDCPEKCYTNMGVPSVPFNGGLMLHNPVRQVHCDTFVPQEFKSFVTGVGFKQIPEIPSNSHCNWSG